MAPGRAHQHGDRVDILPIRRARGATPRRFKGCCIQQEARQSGPPTDAQLVCTPFRVAAQLRLPSRACARGCPFGPGPGRRCGLNAANLEFGRIHVSQQPDPGKRGERVTGAVYMVVARIRWRTYRLAEIPSGKVFSRWRMACGQEARMSDSDPMLDTSGKTLRFRFLWTPTHGILRLHSPFATRNCPGSTLEAARGRHRAARFRGSFLRFPTRAHARGSLMPADAWGGFDRWDGYGSGWRSSQRL